MPPLNEGTILYMPAAVPGISIREATKILQIQDRILKRFPEVESVFGKAGQADTSTDPAPLSMFETVVQLKPPEQWPRRDDLAETHRGDESGNQDSGNGTNILDADSNPDRDADHRISFCSRHQNLRSDVGRHPAVLEFRSNERWPISPTPGLLLRNERQEAISLISP